MYKIEFSENFGNKIIDFTRKFHSKNTEQVIDSGLDDENAMVENYNLLAKALRTTIVSKIFKYFTQDLVPKNVHEREGIVYSVITVHTVRVFVYFREDVDSKTRHLESIEFFRK